VTPAPPIANNANALPVSFAPAKAFAPGAAAPR
jgi:hypothetical protein